MHDISFFREISLGTITELLGELRKDGLGRRVLIKSPGGTFEFFSIFAPAFIRQGFTSVGYEVSSAAIILFLLGNKRFVLPESTFFFHEVRAIIGAKAITICNVDEAIDWAREMSRALSREPLEEFQRQMNNAQNWMLSFISQRTNTEPSIFLDLMRQEVTLSAQEAVYYGLASRIISEDEFRGGVR